MEEGNGKPPPLPPSQENHMTAFNSKYSGGLNNSPIGSPGGTDLSEVKSADIRKKINIGTWNVRSLFEAGKLANLIQEMKRLDIDIMGVAETWWPDAGVCSTGGGAFYYSGNQDKNHWKGVGIIVSGRFKNCIIDFIPYSDRIALIKINARPTNLNIIQIYAPTADAPDEEMEIFYEQIKEMLKLTKKHDMNIIMGDFNSRIGKERYEDLMGPFGLGIRNERGERLVQFCQEEDMRVTNTWYQLPPRRLYTWRSPRDSPENISRNQIDFILINKRFGSSINRVSTYPGADVSSDHILLRATIKIKLTKYVKPVSKRGIAYERLKQGDIKTAMRHEINNNIEEMLSSRGNEQNSTKIWKELKNDMINTAKSHLGYREKNRRQNWMTDEILSLMDERRTYKNQADPHKYNEMQREIRAKIRTAKNMWLKQECKEMEKLQTLHDDFNLHKRLKEIAGIYRKRTFSAIVDENNNLANDIQEKKIIWEKYVGSLFADERPDRQMEADSDNLTGPSIIMEEIKKAINTAKTNKAAGPDEVPSELLKLLNEKGLALLLKIFNKI
ncbi:craniofacial development protein 2-like [Nylanderia fulva]|uniref:craniofacial development protein 2-like n=1 Tax=Nylanderia fulva TaxID=613905 RepID=UPI0010FB17A3|nr:craniofacial development protein 2-like [Nylanderia fulva]